MKKIVKTSHSLRIRQAEIRAKSFFFGDTLQILKTVLEHQTSLELIHSRIMKIILYTARIVGLRVYAWQGYHSYLVHFPENSFVTDANCLILCTTT
jgi:hypothetical protein